MYAAGHHIPDSLRPTDSHRLGSLPRADLYVLPPNTWQQQQQQQQHAPTSPRDGQWAQISAHQLHSMPGRDSESHRGGECQSLSAGSDVSPVRAGSSTHNSPLDAREHAHGYISDPPPFVRTGNQRTQGFCGGMSSGTGGAGASVKRGQKRPRAAHQASTKRTGACTRCRRLKMKCKFTSPADEACSRCGPGGYECIVPRRKPRSPTMRVVLRKRIRETDAMIDSLLLLVNPGTTMATPLVLAPARLPLSSQERTEHCDVLSYLERAAHQGAQRFDISALEGGVSEDSDTDEDVGMASGGAVSPVPGNLSPTNGRAGPVQPPVDSSSLEVMAPMAIMATAALQSGSTAASALPDDSSTDSAHSHLSNLKGIAGEGYFLPGPQANLRVRRLIVERQAAPGILVSGLVTPVDVTALFEIYYKWINPIVPLLDENIHSPASVLARCPFLFTVICTVASRYYKEKPHIYGMAIHFAKAAAANAIIDGWKTVETCQAFTLWSLYNPPARRLEETRAWCYTGIAFRLATELNLSRTPEPFADERQERESHSRTRMWLLCFVADRCLSIHLGKAWMVQEDAVIRNVASWLHNVKYHNQCDGYLTSLTELLIIMSRFVGMVNPAFGTSSVESVDDLDFSALYKAFNDELMVYKDVIDERHRGEKQSSDPAIVVKIRLIYCVFHYCRLVICCCGMQLMARNKTVELNAFFDGCLQAATSLVKLMAENCVSSGFVPYFPELLYVISAFAAVVLLKFLRPEYNAYLDIQQEESIIELVQRFFTVWTSASDHFSPDECHNMQLYAKFLKQLMEPHVARLSMKKRAESVFGRNTPSPAPPAAASVPPLRQAGNYVNNNTGPSKTRPERPPAWPTAHSGPSTSAMNSPVFLHHIPSMAPAAASPFSMNIEDLYATDIAVHPDANVENVSWEQLMAAGMLGSEAWSGAGDSAMDRHGMSSDECLAAMMGLGDSAMFLTTRHGGS
ncbi:hypothetical protein V8D89_005308 [Ganoderma adspersum]